MHRVVAESSVETCVVLPGMPAQPMCTIAAKVFDAKELTFEYTPQCQMDSFWTFVAVRGAFSSVVFAYASLKRPD